MSYEVGNSVNHSTFGRGRIVGYSNEKDYYRVKFDKRIDGMETRNIHKDNIRLFV
jgi:hypothetical protein